MKKILFSLGVMLSAFALTNCTQEIENPAQQPESAGYPFEIVASTVDTKTVNDGMSTKWAAKDTLNIFHAEAGATAYSTNDFFVISDTEEGRFKGNLTEAIASDKSYDWYVLYPYSRKITTPTATGPGFTYIGHSKGLNQTGYNSMAALKGSVCPLYGVAKAVAGSDMPSIEMNHISSVVAINVTNMNDEPLTITTASFTAPEDIVGSYYIDITKTPVECNPSGSDYVNSTAEVNVSNGTALKKGDSAILYAAIKPFTAIAGQKLTLSVNGYPKDITLPKDVTFSAGKIKTLNFAYDKVEEPTPEGVVKATLTFDDIAKRIVSTTSQQVWSENDITLTYDKAGYNNNLAEYAKPMRFYKGTTITIETPGNIAKIDFECNSNDYAKTLNSSIAGSSLSSKIVTIELDGTSKSVTYTMSEGQVRMDALTVTYNEGEGGETPGPGTDSSEPIEVSVADFLAAEGADQIYILTGTIGTVKSAEYGNFYLVDETGEVYIYGLVDETDEYVFKSLGLKENDEITIKGKRTIYNGNPQMENALYVSHTPGEAPEDVMKGKATIEEVLAADVNAHVWYEMTGVIASAPNTTYGNFNLKDETGTIYVYGLTSEKVAENDKSFASLGLKEGDIVTLIGTRADYNGTAQVGGPAYYVSHEASCDAPVITCENNIVTITAASGTTIYYTINGNEPTNDAEIYTAPFRIDETINVKAIAVIAGKPQSAVASQTCYWIDPNGGEETIYEAELSFANKSNRTSFSSTQQVWEQNGIVFTNDKASSNNAVADYANPVRLYQGSSVTITMSGDSEKITKIEFESDGTSKYKTALLNSLAGAGVTPSYSGNFYTVELPGPSASFTFSLTAQARLKNIKVTYQK